MLGDSGDGDVTLSARSGVISYQEMVAQLKRIYSRDSGFLMLSNPESYPYVVSVRPPKFDYMIEHLAEVRAWQAEYERSDLARFLVYELRKPRAEYNYGRHKMLAKLCFKSRFDFEHWIAPDKCPRKITHDYLLTQKAHAAADYVRHKPQVQTLAEKLRTNRAAMSESEMYAVRTEPLFIDMYTVPVEGAQSSVRGTVLLAGVDRLFNRTDEEYLTADIVNQRFRESRSAQAAAYHHAVNEAIDAGENFGWDLVFKHDGPVIVGARAQPLPRKAEATTCLVNDEGVSERLGFAAHHSYQISQERLRAAAVQARAKGMTCEAPPEFAMFGLATTKVHYVVNQVAVAQDDLLPLVGPSQPGSDALWTNYHQGRFIWGAGSSNACSDYDVRAPRVKCSAALNGQELPRDYDLADGKVSLTQLSLQALRPWVETVPPEVSLLDEPFYSQAPEPDFFMSDEEWSRYFKHSSHYELLAIPGSFAAFDEIKAKVAIPLYPGLKPESPEFAARLGGVLAYVQQHPLQVAQMGKDFLLAVQLVDYMAALKAPLQLYCRQLALPHMDTKFIERNYALLQELFTLCHLEELYPLPEDSYELPQLPDAVLPSPPEPERPEPLVQLYEPALVAAALAESAAPVPEPATRAAAAGVVSSPYEGSAALARAQAGQQLEFLSVLESTVIAPMASLRAEMEQLAAAPPRTAPHAELLSDPKARVAAAIYEPDRRTLGGRSNALMLGGRGSAQSTARKIGGTIKLDLPQAGAKSAKRGFRGFLQRWTFKDKPDLVRLRVLDPSLCSNLLSSSFARPVELSLELDALKQLEGPFANVIICENEVSCLALPRISNTIALFGSGYAVLMLSLVPFMHTRNIIYWGDIDTHGFDILNRLRRALFQVRLEVTYQRFGGYDPDFTCRNLNVRSMFMDTPTLLSLKRFWVKETKTVVEPMSALLRPELDCYEDLISNKYGQQLRLEQEYIPYSQVLAKLKELLPHETIIAPDHYH